MKRFDDLVEDAAVREMSRLRFLPSPENAINGDEVDLGEAREVLFAGELGARRTKVVLGDDRLGRRCVEILEIGLGNLPYAFRVDIAVHDRDRGFGKNRKRRRDDFELILAEFLKGEESVVLPGDKHVADPALGEGDGRSTRAGVE